MTPYEEMTHEEKVGLVYAASDPVVQRARELLEMTDWDFCSDAGRGRLDVEDLEAWIRLKKAVAAMQSWEPNQSRELPQHALVLDAIATTIYDVLEEDDAEDRTGRS